MKRQPRSALAFVLDQTGDAVITTDLEMRVRTWNRAAARIYGWTGGEAVGRGVDLLLGTVWEEPAEREHAFRELMSRGIWAGEVVQRRRDGEPIRIWSTVSLNRGPDGKVDGALAVNRDITSEWEAARALDLARAHLVYARHLEAVGALTEAEAPAVDGRAQVLMDAVAHAGTMVPDDHPARAALDAAMRAAQILQDDVRRLAARARPASSRHTVIDLAQVLAEMEPMLRVCANVEVESSTERMWLRADRVRVEHLLSNLVQGADRVSLRLSADVSRLYLRVSGAVVDWPLVSAQVGSLGGRVVGDTLVLPRSSAPFVAEAGREPLRVAIVEEHDVLREAAVALARTLGHDVVDGADADLVLSCRGEQPNPRPDLPVVALLDERDALKAPAELALAIDAALGRVN